MAAQNGFIGAAENGGECKYLKFK